MTSPQLTPDKTSQGSIHTSPGYISDRDALTKRLRRIEGQVRGIERMVGDERYCIDILTQISAVSTALDSLAVEVLDDHVNHCVKEALESGEPTVAQAKSQELREAIQRFTKTR